MQRKKKHHFGLIFISAFLLILSGSSVPVSAFNIPPLSLSVSYTGPDTTFESTLSSLSSDPDIPDSSVPIEDIPVSAPDDPGPTLEENIAALRKNSDIWLNFIFPLILAILVIVIFCRWFYHTFIESALR